MGILGGISVAQFFDGLYKERLVLSSNLQGFKSNDFFQNTCFLVLSTG